MAETQLWEVFYTVAGITLREGDAYIMPVAAATAERATAAFQAWATARGLNAQVQAVSLVEEECLVHIPVGADD